MRRAVMSDMMGVLRAVVVVIGNLLVPSRTFAFARGATEVPGLLVEVRREEWRRQGRVRRAFAQSPVHCR